MPTKLKVMKSANLKLKAASKKEKREISQERISGPPSASKMFKIIDDFINEIMIKIVVNLICHFVH